MWTRRTEMATRPWTWSRRVTKTSKISWRGTLLSWTPPRRGAWPAYRNWLPQTISTAGTPRAGTQLLYTWLVSQIGNELHNMLGVVMAKWMRPYTVTVYLGFFAVVLFSRVRPSRKFPVQYMSIYSNENCRKIVKLTPRKFTHIVQNRENICTRKLWCIKYSRDPHLIIAHR